MNNWSNHLATRIATFIRNNHPEAASEDVLKYALITIINTLTSIFIVILISILTFHFVEAIIVVTAFILLRYVSGGVHFSSSTHCIVVTSLLWLALIHIPIQYWNVGFILNLIAVVIFLIKAPSGIEHVSRMDPKYFPLLKVISVFMVCTNFLIQSGLLSLVFFAQACTLFQLTFKLVNYMERGDFQ